MLLRTFGACATRLGFGGAAAMQACGSDAASSTPDAGSTVPIDATTPIDAPTDVAVGNADADAAHDATPSPRPTLPQAVNPGNPVFASPRFVAVTFAGDPRADAIEGAVSAIVSSQAFWSEATSEYGVGPATAAPLRLPFAAPASVDQTTMRLAPTPAR